MPSLPRVWYQSQGNLIQYALTPLAWLYAGIIAVRQKLYQWGIFRTAYANAPVIVVGNITVGGTGKTPVIAWLAEQLRAKGYHPGVVSRGYGGHSKHYPLIVRPDSCPREAGDEPVMLAQQTGLPVVVAPKRIQAAQVLTAQFACDVILSDDGLQHLSLAREVEIMVLDGVRRLGNGRLLPAGPLREPANKLAEVDAVVANGLHQPGEFLLYLKPTVPIPLLEDAHKLSEAELKQKTWHAVAGIGHPERFFQTLRHMGYQIIEHAFADHHAFTEQDLAFGDAPWVIMTEKDAVKCRRFATKRHYALPVTPVLPPQLLDVILDKIQRADSARS